MRGTLSSSTAAAMIANPPASTGTRSGLMPERCSREKLPAPTILCAAAQAVRRDAAGRQAFSSRIAASASAVPDDAYASRQCSGPNSRAIASISARACVSAAANASARSSPCGKEPLRHADAAELQRFEALGRHAAADDELGRAAADVDDEARLGRRRQLVRDAEIDEPRLLVPPMTSIGKPERRFRLRQEFGRILSRRETYWSPPRAPRTDAAPTGVRESARGMPAQRAARAASGGPCSSMPAPKRIVSRHVSRRKIWSPSTRPISSRKLFEPRSTTASVAGSDDDSSRRLSARTMEARTPGRKRGRREA
jgi:hypothetical protein